MGIESEKYQTPIEGGPFHLGELENPRYLPQGGETETRPIDIVALGGDGAKREMKGKFILKKGGRSLQPEIRDEYTEASFAKLMKLKEINTAQKEKGGHQFNLPTTMRLIRDSDGHLAILETDLTSGGKKTLIDLKYANEWNFDEETKKLIADTVTADMDTAAEYGVNLNGPMNIYRPLDTWCLVQDESTGEKKVYIHDVGTFVLKDDVEESLVFSKKKTAAALDELRTGPEIKRFPERALPEGHDDEY